MGGANGGLYRRKVGSEVIAVRRGGAIHALDSIHHFLHIAQMIVPGASYWNVGIGREIGEVERDEEGLRNMRTLGENIAWLLKLTRGEASRSGSALVSGIHHISVHTADLDASLRLYRDLLGMTVVNEFGTPERRILLLDSGDGSHIELTAPASAPAHTPTAEAPLLHIALRSADVRGAVERVRNAGYAITVEPKDVQLGPQRAVIAFFTGPSGESIELFQAGR